MKPRQFDEFFRTLQECTSVEAVFAEYRRDVVAEGFENVVFARVIPNGEHEIPLIERPSELPRVYLRERFVESDPVVVALQFRSQPFLWTDIIRQHDWSKRSREAFGVCDDLGCKNGLTIPFHRPNNGCDMFSLSFRDTQTFDPKRLAAVNLKSYAAWLRINEIDSAADGNRERPASEPAAHHASCCHLSEPDMDITDDECRAIVATDISYRRYKAGLIALNAALPEVLGKDTLANVLHRGLIYEDTDDEYWRFVFRPGPVARSHLKACPAVPHYRDEICRHIVSKAERPQV